MDSVYEADTWNQKLQTININLKNHKSTIIPRVELLVAFLCWLSRFLRTRSDLWTSDGYQCAISPDFSLGTRLDNSIAGSQHLDEIKWLYYSLP